MEGGSGGKGGRRGQGQRGHTPVVNFKSSSSQTTLLDRNILYNVTAMAAHKAAARTAAAGSRQLCGGGAIYSTSDHTKSSCFVDSGVAGVSHTTGTTDLSSEHPDKGTI